MAAPMPRKMLHTSITVLDMDETIAFYEDHFDMKLARRREIPDNDAEIAFLESPGVDATLELTWWKDKDQLDEGDLLDHIAFSVDDVEAAVEELREAGAPIEHEPYQLSGSGSTLAFVRDPNGIWIELIERPG